MMNHATCSTTQTFFSSPASGTTNSKTTPRPIVRKPIKKADLEALQGVATSLRDRALLLLLIQSGLRAGEIAGLDRDTIESVTSTSEDGSELKSGKGQVFGSKVRVFRPFWVAPDCLAAVNDYLATDRTHDDDRALFTSKHGTRITTRGLHNILVGWSKLAGIEPIDCHRFRHTFASNLVTVGFHARDLGKVMGFSNPSRVMQHFHESEDSLARRILQALMRFFDRQ